MNPLDEKLKQFAEDEVMFSAVRGLLLSKCDLNTVSLDNSNAEIAEVSRGWLQAREILTKGFAEIERYRRQRPPKKEDKNIV